MDPNATTDAMTMMAAAGANLGTEWGTITTELTGLVGQLGRGELGAAFLAGYQKLASDTAAAVDQCCQRPAEFADLGNQSVTTYTTADQHGHDHLGGVASA